MPAFEVLSLDPTTPQIRAPGAGDTYSFPRAITPSGANVTPITVSGYSLTGSNAQSMLDLSGTWNTTGTPAAISLNVTDTASNAASRLLNLQVGGANRFYVSKSGGWFSRGGATNTDWFGEPSTVQGWFLFGYGAGSNTVFGMSWSGPEVVLNSGAAFGWSLAGNPVNGADLKLFRDAANTLAQRNGVNAQTKRLYGTYTDVSNYRRVAIAMTTGGVASIAPEGAGTGASGNVLHISGLPTSNPGPGILWNDAGTVKVGT